MCATTTTVSWTALIFRQIYLSAASLVKAGSRWVRLRYLSGAGSLRESVLGGLESGKRVVMWNEAVCREAFCKGVS